MKKLLLALGVASVLATPAFATDTSHGVSDSSGALPAGSANPAESQGTAATGTVTFTGAVTGRTCKVGNNGAYTFELKNVSALDINKGKNTAEEFTVSLVDCSVNTNDEVAIRFDGNNAQTDEFGGHGLKNLVSDGTNAVLLLKKTDGTVLELVNRDATKRTLDGRTITTESIDFKFKAAYAKNSQGDDVEVGRFQANIPFTVVYK